MSSELYKKYRPENLDDVVEQGAAVQQLNGMISSRRAPHTMLFTGPSGCGKTTLARIMRVALGCSDGDFQELNAAKERGIDMVRAVAACMGRAPLHGRCRVWLIDEAHQLSKDAQGALLKMLEDTPKHVYFMLATTDPQKLQAAIKTRCTEIKTKAVTPAGILKLMARVIEAEGLDVCQEALDKIVEVADGSPRRALVVLDQVRLATDPDEQLKIAGNADFKEEAFALCRLLVKDRVTWSEVATFLKQLKDQEQDAEGIRLMVLGYFNSILLGNTAKLHNRAWHAIDIFARNFYDSKFAGLTAACYELVVNPK